MRTGSRDDTRVRHPLGPGDRRGGLLADSLPDKFGSVLIDAWLARQGRTPESFDPVQRLCYVGHRGMGALEFEPSIDRGGADAPLQIDVLVERASSVLRERETLGGRFRPAAEDSADAAALQDILRVGTSAGGARAKALVGWHPRTGEYRSGQLDAPDGFGHWLLKFDGEDANRDKELADPQGYGRIEYGFHLMALAAGLEMTECRLHEEGERAHFMTRRFDRTEGGRRLHMQSLGALAHYDYNAAGAYAYEQALQALQAMLRLRLDVPQLEQQVRRTLFNVVARNQDDHVKNIAFLMDSQGRCRLAPAFDVTWAYNPDGDWTARHQMTINGRRDGFSVDDLCAMGRVGHIKAGRTYRRHGQCLRRGRHQPGRDATRDKRLLDLASQKIRSCVARADRRLEPFRLEPDDIPSESQSPLYSSEE